MSETKMIMIDHNQTKTWLTLTDDWDDESLVEKNRNHRQALLYFSNIFTFFLLKTTPKQANEYSGS